MPIGAFERHQKGFTKLFHVISTFTRIRHQYLFANVSGQKFILLCEDRVAPLGDYSTKLRRFLLYTLFRIARNMMSPLDGRSLGFLGDHLRHINGSDTTSACRILRLM